MKKYKRYIVTILKSIGHIRTNQNKMKSKVEPGIIKKTENTLMSYMLDEDILHVSNMDKLTFMDNIQLLIFQFRL